MAATPDGKFHKKLTPTQAAALAADVANGMTKTAAAEKYGVGLRTVMRMLKDDYLPRYQPTPCGTPGAYRRHLRRGERCLTCSDAHATREREAYRAGKRRKDAQPLNTIGTT